MRKRFAHIFTILAVTLLLVGCAARPAEPATVPTKADSPAENTVPAESLVTVATEDPTNEETQAPAATEGADSPAENTVPVEVPATEDPIIEETQVPAATTGNSLPYLQRIERPDQSIYSGPGYDYGFVDTVRKRGTYTIVEEVVDYEGILWGKLKSGIGWVDLTEIQSEDYENALISANYADDNLVFHGAYHHCPGNDPQYDIPIAFRAYGKLRDVALFGYEFNADGYYPGADFFTLPEMTQEMPLVAELVFPGDMTMYGIRFVDEAGVTHVYSIYISGRNGALMLTEE